MALDVERTAPVPRAGRDHRNGFRRAGLVTGVVALAGVIAGVGDLVSGPVLQREPPSIPAVIAGDANFTASVRDDPGGRAAAVYVSGNSELFWRYRPLVVGADGDTYRRVDAIADRAGGGGGGDIFPATLISPDGEYLLVSDGDSAVRVDLTNGRERSYQLAPEGNRSNILAWAPDGRRVAFTAIGWPGSDRLAVLDVETGVTTDVPRAPGSALPSVAAFAPDGSRLALQIEQHVELVAVAGGPVERLPLEPGHGLVPDVAWSPDGSLLATTLQGDYSTGRIAFLATAGGARPEALRPPGPTAETRPEDFIGWSGPDRVVTLTRGGVHDWMVERELVEISVADRSRRPVGRFSGAHTCEYGGMHCQALDVRFASGLLKRLVTRPAGRPDRGPWPVWLTTLAVGSAAVATRVGVRVARAVGRRARPAARATM